MNIGQAMLVNESESLGTPATIGWLSKIHYVPHKLHYEHIMTTSDPKASSEHYPDGLFSVWVYDCAGPEGDILVDLRGNIYDGPPDRDGVMCMWP